MALIKCLIPAYDTLTPGQISKINDNSLIVQHKRGEFVFSQDKPISYLMYLRKGLVKLFKEEQQNKSTILKIIGSNNYISLLSIYSGSRYQLSAMAIEDSEVVYTSLQVLNEVLAENGKFALQLLQQFSNEGLRLLNKLIYFPQKQIPGRIAEVLLYFSTEIYSTDDFTLPLSRQELADLIYSTKESVSRTLTEFKNDRMIDINDRKVTLKSIDLLQILSKLG